MINFSPISEFLINFPAILKNNFFLKMHAYNYNYISFNLRLNEEFKIVIN